MHSDSVLRRKLGRRPVVQVAEDPGIRAFRLAFARAAETVPAFRPDIGTVAEAVRSLAELLDGLPERALLTILEGPGEGLGLMAMDPVVVAALIEAMTTGRVTVGAATPRKPTRTDAAMSAGLIDGTLAGLEAVLLAEGMQGWVQGFRYASFLDDARPLGLLLEDRGYRVLAADLALGEARRVGRVLLALPAAGQMTAAAAPDPSGRQAQGAPPPQGIGDGAMLATAELSAVLHRLSLPLSAVLLLKAGDVLALPAAALDAVSVEGIDGRRLATGKLGQNHGFRALRLQRIGDAAGPAPSKASAPATEPAGRRVATG
ncbi:MAG: FliM/FliN family flagellar motor switch protein [Paracoccaceae bacterium]|nr:FliM/FliN family flagellar motor switch protein [Paracoccaceae bacterium]